MSSSSSSLLSLCERDPEATGVFDLRGRGLLLSVDVRGCLLPLGSLSSELTRERGDNVGRIGTLSSGVG